MAAFERNLPSLFFNAMYESGNYSISDKATRQSLEAYEVSHVSLEFHLT